MFTEKDSYTLLKSDAIAGLEMDEFRDVLVAVKGIEEFVVARVGKHKERARGHGFGWFPNEEIYLRVIVNTAMEFSHVKPLLATH